MKKTESRLNEVKLVGITTRTRNSLEMNPETSKIGKIIEKYYQHNLSQKISNRIKPGTTYCAYTEYASDEDGEYTYFVGEAVDSFDRIDPMFSSLTIPSSKYAKFECGPGEMPMVCIDAWKKIWQMSNEDLGGKRTYITDFEIYDERAIDCSNTLLDIFIGIQN